MHRFNILNLPSIFYLCISVGEAQIAIVDLLGIFCGIKISKAVGINKFTNIIFVYAALQVLELVCMYNQISSVVFTRMNFERLWRVTNIFLDHKVSPTPEEICESERIFIPPGTYIMFIYSEKSLIYRYM